MRRLFLLSLLMITLQIARSSPELTNDPVKIPNPHINPELCIHCHTDSQADQSNLMFQGEISKLCRFCHDGRKAKKEVHPADMIPDKETAGRIPEDMPLENGKMTCLTCHDAASRCTVELKNSQANTSFLRRVQVSPSMMFCAECHVKEKYTPFNVHNQLVEGKINKQTCIWCHVSVPQIESKSKDDATEAEKINKLRSNHNDVCCNCHRVPYNHPTDGVHVNAQVPPEMLSYMAAHELQPSMKLPFEQLLRYVRAANRQPETIPLADGRVTCYSCHNPHVKGLFSENYIRSVGADTGKAQKDRLRVREGIICISCHSEGVTK